MEDNETAVGVPMPTRVAMSDNAPAIDVYTLHLEATDSNFKTVQTVHLFTEKELLRAVRRYTTDSKLIRSSGNGIRGSVFKVEYLNANGSHTVRCLVRFDPVHVDALDEHHDVTALFTPREMKRSKKRYGWYFDKSWFAVLMRKIRGLVQ